MGSRISERYLASLNRIRIGATLLRASRCAGARTLHHAIGVREVSFSDVIVCRIEPQPTASRHSYETGSGMGKRDARYAATLAGGLGRAFIAGAVEHARRIAGDVT